jgi:hypothetical protein
MKHIVLVCILLLCAVAVWAQESPQPADSAAVDISPPPPAPVTNAQAKDKPNDHGHAVEFTWEASPDDPLAFPNGAGTVGTYEIFRWKPDYAVYVDSLLQRYLHARDGRNPDQVHVPGIRRAIDQVRAGVTNMTALSFVPALAIMGDTLIADTGLLIGALEDTLAVFETPMLVSRDSLIAILSVLEEAAEKLPEAYATYPDNGSWFEIGVAAAGATSWTNNGSKDFLSPTYVPDFADFYHRIDAVSLDDPALRSSTDPFGPVQSKGQWFNTGRSAVLVAVLLFGFFTVLFVTIARKGRDLYVRPLAGIEAVDDAIGRATEMGKPILYVLGLGTADMVATIASFTILGRVGKRVAEYQTPLLVPAYDPVVMAVAQEVVKSAYLDAGRPDEYKEDTVFFVTNMQFAYVAAVNGIMLRELPATNFYMGKFFAESLLLAETGAVAGSVQIAGTDEIAQIPFFIVACDYTLIGEELYAASAYLGREPILLGSLKAQDYAKAAFVVCAVLGLVAANLEWAWFTELFHVSD